jgi:hypothetical protein
MGNDQGGIIARLKAVLPLSWFPDATPVLDGVLAGLAAAWVGLISLLDYVRLQTRLATATDDFLDMAAADFFGTRVRRRPMQSDAAFRPRVIAELLRERATRSALVSVLTDLTGRPPDIFEPARATDTGGWGGSNGDGGGLGYGVAGGWGSLSLPFQCFVVAYRPLGAGIAGVSGWGGPTGGYGCGSLEYASADMVQGQVTDADIFRAVADTMPVASIAWTRITD